MIRYYVFKYPTHKKFKIKISKSNVCRTCKHKYTCKESNKYHSECEQITMSKQSLYDLSQFNRKQGIEDVIERIEKKC